MFSISICDLPFFHLLLFSQASIFYVGNNKLSKGRRKSGVNEGEKKTERQIPKARARERNCTTAVTKHACQEPKCLHAACACVCFSDMTISWDGCPWTWVYANRYLSLTDHPFTSNYTRRSKAGGTGLSRIYINLHVSLGPAAASGTLYESRSQSADNLFKFNKIDGGKVK